MEEIKAKYIISDFKEKSGKRKLLKFESIDLDIYKPSAHCASFLTSPDRIHYWIYSFQQRYYETLKDSTHFKVIWIDHEESSGTTPFQDIEIKILSIAEDHPHASGDLSQSASRDDETKSTLITIHAYLTTGVIMFQGIAYKLWAEHEFPLLKDFTDTSVDQAPQEPLFTFEDTELLFKNLDTAVLCLPTNKTKSLKKRKADQPGTCTEQFDHAFPTNLKTKSDIGEDNMASCATPRPQKRRNSLDSLLTPRQSNSIATLKELISKIEADVAELRNANDHHIEEQVFALEDKITQMGNSTKVDSQTLHSRMQDLETENEFLKAENAKMKSENSKLKADIHFIKSEIKQIKCLLQSNNSSENSTGSNTINGPAGRSDLSDHNSQSLPTMETNPPSEQSQYPEDASIPLSNSFSGLMDDDPGDGDIHTASPSHSPNDVRHATQEILTRKENEKSQTNRPPQHEKNQSTINSIIMLIDSNGKYIDCERFSPRTPTHQYFTPTITSATDLLTTNDLGNPSHIIIHTGTNDLEKLRTSQCISNYHELLKLVSEKHSSSKVIVSSLLIRADGIDKQRQEFNTKLGHLCAPYPNVHLVNNDNITVENRIGLLVTNLKDTVFNRLRRIQSRNLPSNLNTRVLDLPPSPTSRILSTPGQREFLPRVPVPGNNHLGLGGKPLYSSVVKRNATNPPPLNIETVLNLLNLYETMRQN